MPEAAIAAPNAGAETQPGGAAGSQPAAIPAPISYENFEVQPDKEQAAGRPAGDQPESKATEPAKPAEAKPAEPGAESQEKMPWDKDPRFIEANHVRKELLAQKEQIDALRALVPTAEDAQHLLTRLEQAQQTEAKFQSLNQAFAQDPVNLALEWQRTHPEGWAQVLAGIRQGVLMDLVEEARAAGNVEAETALAGVLQGLQTRPPASPRDAQLRDREQQLAGRERALEEQRSEAFLSSVTDRVEQRMRSEFTELVKGISFPSEAAKEYALDSALQVVRQTLDADVVWNDRFVNLLRGSRDERHVQSFADENVKRALANRLFAGAVAKALSDLGFKAIADDAAQRRATEQAAQQRKEPAGAQSPAQARKPTPAEKIQAAQKAGKDPYHAIFDE